MMNWNTSIDCCNWHGVTCNHFTGDVIGINLSCGKLRGIIHPNSSLFHLSHLQRLNLAYNDFSDSNLPPKIGRFANSLTHLNISDSGFTGQIPSDISLLHKLVSLDLSLNGFNSRLQPHVFNNLLQNSTLLRELSLRDVNISSVLPIYLNVSSSLKSLDLKSTGLQGKLPDNIFNLRYLEKLDLSSNFDVTGPFPKVNRSTSIPLNWLSLAGTIVSSREIGEILESIGHLKSLNYLDLSYTNFSGEIPDSIGHLKSLNYLDLSSCNLMGSLPKSLVNLRHLTTLTLYNNTLNGTLPSWLFTLPSLKNINLGGNMFSGGLPSELFNHRSLQQLSLSSNQFVGEINQGSIIQLTNLTTLGLASNNFTGVWELDTLLSSLPNLRVLVLSYSGLSVVTNNATGYVNPDFFGLSLRSCMLTVFPESLRAMKNLKYLDLSGNDIRGRIPDWAGEIGGNELDYLNLSYNSITGLPQLQWDGLEYLDVRSNLIQGPFPPSICNLSNPMYLDMSNNSFGGVIPQCLGNICSSLPNVYEDFGQLQGLILNGNQLEGEVPSSLSKCQFLKVLDLGNNHLNGTFPGWLGDLRQLQVLVLKSNYLHGAIETSSTIELPFPSLRVLDLSHNGFVGHLSRKYFQNFNVMKDVVKKGPKPEYLNTSGIYYSIIVGVKGHPLLFLKILVDYTIVDLSSNKFEGEIPNVIGSLNSLKVLNLSHNNINGQIPHALGNLLEIESLDLSWNKLIGEIPQGLADITALEVLNLSQNHLMGRIPEGKQFNTFEGNSFGGNPELCGFPLTKHCEHSSSPQLEADEDTKSGFTWKVVMLGYGCGTLAGLVMGYLMLSTGRPKWFNAIADAGEHMIRTRRNKRRHVYIGK